MAPTWEFAALLLAAFGAGLVDAVAGGGGLIQVPALFSALPLEMPATVFGTNKGSSVFGTANAAWRYARRVPIPWSIALPAAGAAFVFSFAGAATVAWLPKDIVRPLILALLVVVAAYTALRPNFGVAPAAAPRRGLGAVLLVGAGLGFYDGFFGPGMGSFLIFAFVRWFGLDFLRASAAAKVVNGGTNLAALAYFAPSGHVLWGLALSMAAFNVAGANVGAHLAIRRGSGFVRGVFLAATGLLIAKFGYDTYITMVK
ncbi:MAG: TSUP family transporter [Rhodocyclaceae bacterium]|nr:TSUP family transporter [Rhodocyclaceae bacterium]